MPDVDMEMREYTILENESDVLLAKPKFLFCKNNIVEQSRAEARRQTRAENGFKKNMKRRYSSRSLYNQPVMVKPPKDTVEVPEGDIEITQTMSTAKLTDSKRRKENKKMLQSTITLPFFGRNRSSRHTKVRMSNKKHTWGRINHSKIHKHLNNAI